MLIFVTIIHVLLCVFMMFVILLQPGKDAGMGAAFGGGAATSAFGGRGAVTFLSKVTAVCAALFFLTSLGLSFVGMSGSLAARVPAAAPAPASESAPIPGGAPPPAATSETNPPAGSAPNATGAPAPAEAPAAEPAAPPSAQPAPSEAR